ncbi:MAG: hypothetical protein M1142_02270 [Patescibacteria group bacterium]|nr:hypothetical protein [Patescibacteria group bacterium]
MSIQGEPIPGAGRPEAQTAHESPTLLEGNDPLFGLHLLSDQGITGTVYDFVYVPEKYSTPQGLGQLLPRAGISARARDSFPSQPGRWLVQPKEGQMYVIKVAHQEQFLSLDPTQMAYYLDTEILNLRILNALFPDVAVGRPPRILGFGLQEADKLSRYAPYIIMEYIGQGFGGQFISLERYIQLRQTLDPKEALTIAARLAFVITKAHETGITHNDLEAGALQNIFWDPAADKLRLIDWANSQNILLQQTQGLSYGYDRKGISELLFKLITGTSLTELKKQYANLPEGAWQKVPPSVRTIIERSYGLAKDPYDPSKAGESKRMLSDIGIALRQYSSL